MKFINKWCEVMGVNKTLAKGLLFVLILFTTATTIGGLYLLYLLIVFLTQNT